MTDTDVTLTESERETLWDAIGRTFLDLTVWDRDSERNLERAVEGIIARRIAGADR